MPPGTRTSLYENPDYLKVAPFAQADARLDRRRRPEQADRQAVPYVGVQLRAIPEFQGIGTTVGQQFSAALCRLDHGRRGARGGASLDRTRDEARRLHQVAARFHSSAHSPGLCRLATIPMP